MTFFCLVVYFLGVAEKSKKLRNTLTAITWAKLFLSYFAAVPSKTTKTTWHCFSLIKPITSSWFMPMVDFPFTATTRSLFIRPHMSAAPSLSIPSMYSSAMQAVNYSMYIRNGERWVPSSAYIAIYTIYIDKWYSPPVLFLDLRKNPYPLLAGFTTCTTLTFPSCSLWPDSITDEVDFFVLVELFDFSLEVDFLDEVEPPLFAIFSVIGVPL